MSSGWLEYLQRARWYAGKDEGRLSGIEPLGWYTPAGVLPAVRSELATVERTDDTEIYHLLVGYLPPGTAEPEALVERTELPGFGDVDVVDAAASVTAIEAMLNALDPPEPSSPRRRGSLSSGHPGWEIPASAGMTSEPERSLRSREARVGFSLRSSGRRAGARIPAPRASVAKGRPPVRLLPAQQSNSAAVAGESLVKIYRRLRPGINPEPELLAALSGGPVPALHGVIRDRDYDLLVALEYLPDAADGWEFATAACAVVRPIDAELHALGQALREVHSRLAEAFGTRTNSGAALRERLLNDIEEAVVAVPQLQPHRAALAAVLGDLPDGDIPTQRVHGDFHLGQVLLTEKGWRIIDFEGEPGAPIAERRAFDTPWRDVAGLLRSLDYARSAHPEPSGSEATQWCERSRTAFLAGYGDEPGAFPVMFAHEVARMVYEVGYEVRNRPDWVGIPLSAVENVATRH